MYIIFLPSGTQHTSHRTPAKAKLHADFAGISVRITASRKDITRDIENGTLRVDTNGATVITGSGWTVEEHAAR